MKKIWSIIIILLCCLASWAQKPVFSIDTIPDAVFLRMQGKSYPAGCKVKRSELRYLTISHHDGKGNVKKGEMVCNKAIAQDLIEIFRKLYEARYPIERMRLIDDYDADDERSMSNNNTSCFCYREVKGTTKLSKHALGMAVDINPLYNPCVKGKRVQPNDGVKWALRSRHSAYMIKSNDLIHRLFKEHGFTWGGSWRTLKDWQHFEK